MEFIGIIGYVFLITPIIIAVCLLVYGIYHLFKYGLSKKSTVPLTVGFLIIVLLFNFLQPLLQGVMVSLRPIDFTVYQPKYKLDQKKIDESVDIKYNGKFFQYHEAKYGKKAYSVGIFQLGTTTYFEINQYNLDHVRFKDGTNPHNTKCGPNSSDSTPYSEGQCIKFVTLKDGSTVYMNTEEFSSYSKFYLTKGKTRIAISLLPVETTSSDVIKMFESLEPRKRFLPF